MREIKAEEIVERVAEAAIKACQRLPKEVVSALESALATEPSPLGQKTLSLLLENARLAEKEGLPICQDTGIVVAWVELGEEVKVKGLCEAINRGVALGYARGHLRKSVAEPLSRKNTGTNTPVIIHVEMVPGDKLKITLMPKGCGSENMSRLAMLPPAVGKEGLKKFALETVERAGPNPCPPVTVGVGIGGTFEKAALLAKKALLRPVGQFSSSEEVASLEREILEEINSLGIGPLGFGGRTTALAVHIEVFPTHIASLPVAVNLQCHAARVKSITF